MAATSTSFTAKDVMSLREKTGLGMMDCKKALVENNGDMAAAEEWLRANLKGKMDSRTERATGEGRIGIAVNGSDAAIIEIRSETDFVARNENFVKTVDEIASYVLKLSAGPIQPDDEITKRIDDLRITTGENVNFARGERLTGGSFGKYLHHDGKRGALVQIEGSADDETLAGVCMHIVAHVPPPIGITADDAPAEIVKKIRSEAIAEAKVTGKPDQIVEKIAEGKVRKYLEENTLLNQKFVKDPAGKTAVKEILPKDVKVLRYERFTVGG